MTDHTVAATQLLHELKINQVVLHIPALIVSLPLQEREIDDPLWIEKLRYLPQGTETIA